MNTGKFIVVEGLEGAGKSSVIEVIEAFLSDCKYPFIKTREPGGTPLAEKLRDCVKAEWEEQVTTETELMLMYAARSQLMENVILPALQNGQWVIGDRHDLSSVAYQGGGRMMDVKIIQSLQAITLKGFTPDLTLYLDVEPEVGLRRARGRGELDRIEQAGLDFFKRTQAAYLKAVSSEESIIRIDAMQAISEVHKDVRRALSEFVAL